MSHPVVEDTFFVRRFLFSFTGLRLGSIYGSPLVSSDHSESFAPGLFGSHVGPLVHTWSFQFTHSPFTTAQFTSWLIGAHLV